MRSKWESRSPERKRRSLTSILRATVGQHGATPDCLRCQHMAQKSPSITGDSCILTLCHAEVRGQQSFAQRVDLYKWPYSPFSKKLSKSSVRFSDSSWSSINFRMTANSACATGREKEHHCDSCKGRAQDLPAVPTPGPAGSSPPSLKLKLHGLPTTRWFYLFFPYQKAFRHHFAD